MEITPKLTAENKLELTSFVFYSSKKQKWCKSRVRQKQSPNLCCPNQE